MLKIKSTNFNALFSLFMLLAYNTIFFKEVYEINSNPTFMISISICVFLIFNIISTILFQSKTVKPLTIIFCLLNAFTFYFMYTYNTAIDKIMFLNVLKTDIYEVRDLLSLNLLLTLIFLGLIPSWIIYKLKIISSPWKQKFKYGLLSAIIVAGIMLSGFQSTENIFRKNKGIKYYLVPVNYIGAIISVAKIKMKPSPELQKISEDAKLKPYWKNNKKNLFVFVMGETARAANFSLNGYHRPTNQPLEKYQSDLIYFHDFKACGTSTAVSLPCVFSKEGRETFETGSEEYKENILDIFNHVGYKVLWRENNTGCYNNCDRIEVEEPCKKDSCLDEVMLENFADKVKKGNQNNLVVLHQRGSHGPAYHQHYSPSSELYTPICTSNNLPSCSTESLVNVYDNTVHYTSEFLSQTIEELKKLATDYNTILIYTSDHGESLGENGQYLHSAPYDEAPQYQTDVPFFLWIPNDFATNFNLDKNCLSKKIKTPFSHDNIYHSLLGLGGISSSTYDENLDIFASCRK